jgi:hypothetical protein
MAKIKGWTKIKLGSDDRIYHKWRRDADNAFLEIADAKEYGYREGYIAVLWAGGAPKPRGIAGDKTMNSIYGKCIQYMKANSMTQKVVVVDVTKQFGKALEEKGFGDDSNEEADIKKAGIWNLMDALSGKDNRKFTKEQASRELHRRGVF